MVVFMKVVTIGGFGDVTGNSVLVMNDHEAVLVDLGLNMENYIKLSREEDLKLLSLEQLVNAKALPDPEVIKSFLDGRVLRAVVLSHAHLDHIGAVPFLVSKLKPELVIGTSFTIELLKSLFEQKLEHKLGVKFLALPYKHVFQVGSFKVRLIKVTHSVPETAVIEVNTNQKTFLYANDFKFDNHPLLGGKSDVKTLTNLNPDVVFMESLYALHHGKALSEIIAKEMLADVFRSVPKDKALIVTTFSSHIARLKSISELAKHLNRKPVMLGRSLHKYVTASHNASVYKFKKIKMFKYRREVNKFLKIASQHPEKYLLIVTGNQGEPDAVLARMIDRFKFCQDDVVVFSSRTIPTEMNIENRSRLVQELSNLGVSVYEDIHVSGHAHVEDLKQFIKIVNPKLVIPSHADLQRFKALQTIARNLGFESKVMLNNQELSV